MDQGARGLNGQRNKQCIVYYQGFLVEIRPLVSMINLGSCHSLDSLVSIKVLIAAKSMARVYFWMGVEVNAIFITKLFSS